MEKHQFTDDFELAVLAAMNKVARQHNVGKGWKDSDLASFLPAIRQHAEKVFDRAFVSVGSKQQPDA